MKVDKKELNIVMHLTDEDENPIIVHSTPLPSAVFEANWKLFSEAYGEMSSNKSMSAAAVLARRIFMEAGENLGKAEEAKDVLRAIAGATFVYTTKPLLLEQANVSREIKEEILSRIVFFICYRRHVFPSMLKGWISAMQAALNLELTSSTASECWPSSTTSTTEEPTGNTVTSSPI
jgi:hypothetical protein